METRAHYILIGAFVLVFVVGLAAAVLWIAGGDINRQRAYYDIFFSDSVAGLSVGGDVRYRGIKVGTVSEIRINAEDPTRAQVTVEVGSTPIREGDEATLVLQGITGVLFVNISGAGPDNPRLRAEPGQRYPVIPSRPSAISEVFEGAPDLMSKAIITLDNLGQIANAENRAHIAATLVNVEELTRSLASRDDQVGRILLRLERSMGELEAAVVTLRATMESTRGLVEDDGRRIAAEVETAVRELRQLLTDADALLAENREPLRDFTTRGLPELSAVAAEARGLLARLSRLADQLEQEGAAALLKPQPREVEVRP